MRLDLYKNIHTDVILQAIGLEADKIPRLRGVGIEDDKVLIHTRTGGGNREFYDTFHIKIHGTNEYLRSSTFFLYDSDDEYDSTYANFWFSIPPKLEKLLSDNTK